MFRNPPRAWLHLDSPCGPQTLDDDVLAGPAMLPESVVGDSTVDLRQHPLVTEFHYRPSQLVTGNGTPFSTEQLDRLLVASRALRNMGVRHAREVINRIGGSVARLVEAADEIAKSAKTGQPR